MATPAMDDILYVSPGYENVWGRSLESLRQQPQSFFEAIHPDDQKYSFGVIKGQREKGFDIEYRIIRPDQTVRWIRDRGFPVKDTLGKIYRIAGVSEDITKRKQAEEKLYQVNSELHRLSSHLQNIQENERTFIAREIHDELGQLLTGLKMEVGWLNKKLPDDPVLIKKGNEILSIIGETLKTVKRIAVDLRPNILDELGLIAALEWQGQEFEKRTGIQSNFFSGHMIHNLEKNLSINIFRVYQEALTNIARHANATAVETILEHVGDCIRLIVKDNGQGFDLNRVKKKDSLGLIGMKERAAMFRGDLIIERNKPCGTIIILMVPIAGVNKILQ